MPEKTAKLTFAQMDAIQHMAWPNSFVDMHYGHIYYKRNIDSNGVHSTGRIRLKTVEVLLEKGCLAPLEAGSNSYLKVTDEGIRAYNEYVTRYPDHPTFEGILGENTKSIDSLEEFSRNQQRIRDNLIEYRLDIIEWVKDLRENREYDSAEADYFAVIIDSLYAEIARLGSIK